MIEAAHDAPRPLASERPRTFAGAIERLDPDSIRAVRDEPVKADAFQGGFGGFPPVGLRPGGKEPRARTQIRGLLQINCDKPGIDAAISPTVWSPATWRA